MKSMMRKTTLREIKQSFGRFFAIFAIVALGVSLFSGLKVTKEVMTGSADKYLKEGQFFDYRLLSTLGFEEEDVEAFAAKEDVRAAEGAVSADIIVIGGNDNESVIKAHSMTENVNSPAVIAGRLPEQADECAVDSALYDESAIGSRIILSNNNAEEDLDNFVYDEYTITGIVQSPLYIQFERGNSSLGNGRVSGFMYLLPEGFRMDVYTEIYVKFDEEMDIYSEEYDSYMEEKEPLWESYCEEQAMRRYDSIMAEAQNELTDAQNELDEKRAEAETELADARAELEDAESEISDGEAKLADGEKELKEAEDAVAAKEDELTETKQTVADNEALLAGKMQECEAALRQLESAGAQSSSAYAQMQAGYAQLLAAQAEIDAAKEQLAGGEAELDKAKKELAEAKKELETKKAELDDARKELADGWTEYNDAYEEFETEIAEAEQKIEDARTEIADIEKPDTYVLDRNTNIGYVCFESDSGIVEGIANVFPVFFFLVAALVCMTTMNRMVEEQRTQIGVLKALGYGEGTIMGKFLFYAGSAALTGCIAGYFLGIHVFPLVIWIAYGMMYRMGSIVYFFDWKLLVISLITALACTMGTTWVSCRSELKEAAAGLMRPKAPKAGKRVFLEYVPFIWKRLKFLQKVSVRNIVRYKKRFFMMVIGISGCTALLVTGFGIRDSVTDIANQQFEEIQVYNLGITMKDGISKGQDEPASFKEIVEDAGGTYTEAYESTLDFEADGSIKTINLIVAKDPETIGGYINLHTEQGTPIAYPAWGEAVISNKLADNYHIKVGDTITLRNEEQKTIQAVVTGICENYIYNYVYLRADTYEKAMGEITYKNIYVNLPENADAHAVSASIMKLDEVTAVTVNADALVRFSSMMSSLNYIVAVIIGCAAALAFVVLYNLNNINITERIREIATIKVLGFYKKETASYVFKENMVLTAIGCTLGLFLGKLLHLYVMHEVDIDMVSFDVKITILSYIFSIILTFFFNWIVNRIMAGKLDRINMAESLKSVD